eukprot:CAMPEP_0119021774 /NCGR_PEP_ID=MMETSP1176-20130426/26664_1 /TAXON_ID=265551 /ORGANISM="Synedropsis recta cf, Strain CCMP1620" /LENGTH=417 /DNA_ID=CAMNT_0006976457 /DNA_START=77 /DNA_END=1327 /DNA_ORIENTATION=+
MSLLVRFASRAASSRCATISSSSAGARRRFADMAAAPIRRDVVTLEERVVLRAARRKRASEALAKEAGGSAGGGGAHAQISAERVKWVWYLGVIVPTGLFAWAYNDENSPPAQLFRMIGLTGLITSYTDEISKPSHEKLLPDWNQMPNVPHDIPVPHTLVLDLEETLVSSTWDRKYGWRHAKRPGVDKFLHTMAQYYEIVLYSPSIDAVADPVVTSLDKTGCIMHRLYRDATHYKNGTHVKDLNRLNRNINRMVLLDDDPECAQFNPDNLIRIKAYEDPMDRTDNTLERITPFLVELARKGHSELPVILRQYKGMDADEIADEYQRRIDNLKTNRRRHPGLLGGLAGGGGSGDLPAPEMTPVNDMGGVAPQQLTAKDLVGAAPMSDEGGGMMGWMNRRAKGKEEQNMLKMEKWNEIM